MLVVINSSPDLSLDASSTLSLNFKLESRIGDVGIPLPSPFRRKREPRAWFVSVTRLGLGLAFKFVTIPLLIVFWPFVPPLPKLTDAYELSGSYDISSSTPICIQAMLNNRPVFISLIRAHSDVREDTEASHFVRRAACCFGPDYVCFLAYLF